MSYDYDLFVIGAGSGGVRASRLAGLLGLKVAVAEEDRPGGTCVLRGCVPKKFLVYASEFPAQAAQARGYGWQDVGGNFDWATLRDKVQDELTRLSAIYSSNVARTGAEIINARAVFKDDHTLILTPGDGGPQREVTAKTILIATGGWPHVPDDVPGVREHAITSNEMFRLKELPQSIVIVGGGFIALEFAGIMNGLGVDTTVVHRGDEILRGFDKEVRAHAHLEFERKGLKILTGVTPTGVEKGKKRLKITLSDGSQLKADQLLYATGRKPNTSGLNLDAAGVQTEHDGSVKVDGFSCTKVPHIYAIGDVTNRLQLTPVAIREAVAFVETAFKDNPTAYDHEIIASAVFSQPEVGTVGLTEDEAVSQGLKVDIYAASFRPMQTLFVGDESRTLLKLLVDRESDVVLGCHMVGPGAGEIIQMAGIAVKAGLTKAQWDATCAVHPTVAEEFVTLRDKRSL
jgi:glutathione reductase (NADPH)